MKQRSRARASSLFLLELIIAILFFAIASAVCVRIFVKAHSLSEEAQINNWAVSECAGFAEIICSSDTADESSSIISEQYPDAVNETSGIITVGYDKEFNPCELSAAEYYIDIGISYRGDMLTGDIIANNGDEKSDNYYELHPQHYIGASAVTDAE